jgi:hypothetical protein
MRKHGIIAYQAPGLDKLSDMGEIPWPLNVVLNEESNNDGSAVWRSYSMKII